MHDATGVPLRVTLSGWALVTAGIAVVDVCLPRSGREMLSHTYWRLLANPSTRWLPVGVWTAITYHLNRPRRRWREAIGVGAVSAFATRVLQ